jgi:hypothetical protein
LDFDQELSIPLLASNMNQLDSKYIIGFEGIEIEAMVGFDLMEFTYLRKRHLG